MSGRLSHVLAVRSNTDTLLRTWPPDKPPSATRRPSETATPRSLRGRGSEGNVVQAVAAGAYASTAAESVLPLAPPTVYTNLPSVAAARYCRGVGMGAPRVQELPSKTSVVFSSAP